MVAMPKGGIQSRATSHSRLLIPGETLIKSLFDFALAFSCNARNHPMEGSKGSQVSRLS